MDVPVVAQIHLSSEAVKTHCTCKKNGILEKDSCECLYTRSIGVKGCENEYGKKAQFLCAVCKKSFCWRVKLYRHIKHAHTAPCTCTLCTKGFNLYSALKNHPCIHTHPFSCNVCNTTFLHERNLMTHRCFIDVTNQTYSSSEYKESFGENSHHKSHQSLLGGKPTEECSYSCNICKKSFRNKNSLVSHKSTHTDKRMAVCDVCGKSYSSPRYVKLHKRMHTGERPYLCSTCKATFTFRHSLVVHIMNNHP